MDFDDYPTKRSSSNDGFFPSNNLRRKPIDFSNDRPRKRPQSLSDVTLTTSPSKFQKHLNISPASLNNQTNIKDSEHAEEKEKHKEPKTPKSPKKIIKRVLISLLVLILVTFGWLGWKFYRDISKVTHDNDPLALLDLFIHSPLKNQSGRINILLAGNSADDPNHQGANLTDSIMVVSLDTKNNTGFMLSIPRDLWVDIPGQGHEKINAAYEVSDFSQAGYPNGGMGQLEEVLSQNLGIPIDYYALIDYSAFKEAVDAVGGITINISSPDPRGLYDPYTNLKLPNGLVTLNGQEALNLARARGDGPGAYGFPMADFNRTADQREMLVAVAKKASSVNIFLDPLKVANLFDAFGNNVQTNLQTKDLLSLYLDTKKVKVSNLQSLNINQLYGQTLLTGYYAPDGEDALIPTAGLGNFTQIQADLQKLFQS